MSPFDEPNLLGALRAAAARRPGTPVVFPESGITLTVAGLRDAAEAFAGELIDAGVRPGDLVGLLAETGPHVLAGFFGVTAAGAAVSMLPNRSALRDRTADHLVSLVKAAGMRVLLADDAHREVAGQVRERHPGLVVLALPRDAAHRTATPPRDPTPTGREPREPDPADQNEPPAGRRSVAAPDGQNESALDGRSESVLNGRSKSVLNGRSVAALDGRSKSTLDGRKLPEVGPEDLAVVQYTSGSVSRPKGVVLRHRTVLAGLHAIAASSRITADDVLVHWVPHYHDMGLFGWLACLLSGAGTHTFSPAGFIRRPARFLEHVAESGGTLTSGPNFGYDLLLDAVDDELASRLDLRRWRLAYNGAEPVAAATVEAFARRFGPGIMYPVYGMAEATLAVTFPEPGRTPSVLHVDREALARTGEVRTGTRPLVEVGTWAQAEVGTQALVEIGTRALVEVGTPVAGLELRVVGEDGTPRPEDVLGEIQIRGAAVTDGYLNDPDATAAAFDGSWLRTGDLGFRSGGRLYVAGRIKEMIIVNGENYFAGDVEHVVRDLPGVFRRRCVAVPEATERMTVIVENRGGDDGLAERVRAAIAARLGLTAVDVRLARPGALPRTTSGKWQRARAGEAIRSSTEPAEGSAQPAERQVRPAANSARSS